MFGLIQFLATGLGLVIGAISRIFETTVQARIRRDEALMKAAGVAVADRQDARSSAVKFQFARRLIVISFMIVLVAPVALVLIDPTTTFNVPTTSGAGSFNFLFGLLGFSEGSGIKYIQVQGFTYVLSIMDMLGLIVGFYFGSGGSRERY